MRALVFVLMVFWIPAAFAGRPVFHAVSLQDLVARSDVIAVVEKKADVGGEGECAPHYWELRVKEALFVHGTPPESPFRERVRAGKIFRVLANEVALTDCRARQVNPSGVSFPAERYAPADPGVVESGKTFLVFLQFRDGQFHLTTNQGFDVLSKKAEVEKWVKGKGIGEGKIPSRK